MWNMCDVAHQKGTLQVWTVLQSIYDKYKATNKENNENFQPFSVVKFNALINFDINGVIKAEPEKILLSVLQPGDY